MSSSSRSSVGSERPLNPVVDAVRARRSYRRGFSPDDIPPSTLKAIVDSGLYAPSSKNAQPWILHVVEGAATRARIAQAMISSARGASYVPTDPGTGEPLPEYESSVDESARVIREARCGVFVENVGPFSGGRRRLVAHPDTLSEAIIGYGFELIGIGAAIENLLLAADSLGVGAVFIGDVLIVEDEVRQMLGMAGDLVGVIALGYVRDASLPDRDLKPGGVILHD